MDARAQGGRSALPARTTGRALSRKAVPGRGLRPPGRPSNGVRPRPPGRDAGAAPRPRAGLVPPRPARLRSRRAAPRAGELARRLLRVRLRPRDPRRLPSPQDRRVEFIWESVRELDAALARARRRPGRPPRVRARRRFPASPPTSASTRCTATTTTSLPRAIATRRWRMRSRRRGISFLTFKDQVIFERDELLTGSGKPYSVFTPYRNAWLSTLTPGHLHSLGDRRQRRRPRTGPGSDRRRAADAGGDGLRADQPRRAARATGDARRRRGLRRFPRPDRRLSRGPRLPGGQGSVVSLGAPALRHRVGARARRVRARMLAAAGRRRRRHLAVRAHLARVLRADPLASPAGGRPRVQARVRRARLSQRPAALRGVVPRADRLPDRRRGDAPARTPPATCTTGCG